MDGDFKFVREPSGSMFRTVDVVMHHGGKFVRDPILRYDGGVVEVKKDEDIDKFTTAGNVVDVPKEISLDEVRELERKRMQEESHQGEEANQGEVGVRTRMWTLVGARMHAFGSRGFGVSTFSWGRVMDTREKE
ncbi:hypothetical protein CRG98_019869 [Punica granatum]|uniref:PB1-like domain-containing protein n=1 Tax=Punica granatum TaxID=22663 RepID=A0A2I0JV21_PUNGR|nr:hypothetical protein CRG98_019869 [Punica granatum]